MEKTGCKIICGAPRTLAVKGLMMMMMMMMMMIMIQVVGGRNRAVQITGNIDGNRCSVKKIRIIEIIGDLERTMQIIGNLD